MKIVCLLIIFLVIQSCHDSIIPPKKKWRCFKMLYPRSKEPQLSDELFHNPSSEYRGAPFWAWNCELKEDELLWQLDVMKQMGLGGAHMHVRTGMATPYLSDEHMGLVKACVEKCRKEKMLAWLYDEDRWPSGAAGGIGTNHSHLALRHYAIGIHFSNTTLHI